MSNQNEKPVDVSQSFNSAIDADFGLDEPIEAPGAAATEENTAEETAQEETSQKPAQKRDDKGRFTAEGDTGAGEQQEDADEDLVYEVVDDETGRKQVFKGKTKDEILDKLLKAQKAASKAIRDRERQIRDAKIKQIAKPGPRIGEDRKPITPEEQIELSNLMVTDPVKAKKRLLEAELGVSPEEAQAAIEQAHANAFMRETPDFYPCSENAQAIADFLKEQKLAPVKQNFAYAFQQLSKAGAFIDRDAAEEQPAEVVEQDQSEVEEAPKPRIVAKPAPTTQKKTASSGISGKRSVRVPANNQAALSDEELEKLPLEELRDRIVALHHTQKSNSR